MKPILFDKRRYTWRDIGKMLFIILGHYFFHAIYVLIILLIKYFIFNTTNFFPPFNYWSWLIYYPLFLGPILSASLHISYSERGKPWLRFIMWFHMVINIIIVPIISFLQL